MQILIIYGSREGQTKKIAEHIATVLDAKGHQVTTLSVTSLPAGFTPEHFAAAIIGGSIHMGKFPKHLAKFITRYRDWLNNIPSVFFTVCMAINSKQPGATAQASHYGENFVNQNGWQPRLTATFAGAVKYTQYDFITRFIMKRISKHEGGSTDTTRDHEYTDWNRVTHFAEQIATVIEDREQVVT